MSRCKVLISTKWKYQRHITPERGNIHCNTRMLFSTSLILTLIATQEHFENVSEYYFSIPSFVKKKTSFVKKRVLLKNEFS